MSSCSPAEEDGREVLALARTVFGSGYDRAVEYAEILRTAGVQSGVIGPREADRIWSRHLLNSAAVASLVPRGASVVDVGSGAGLPGIPLALAREDVTVELLEPLLRRCRFLTEVTGKLGLGASVSVRRGRAPDVGTDGDVCVDVVVARAVAPLDRLVAWSLPLLRVGGQLLALRGRRAPDEVAAASDALRKAGGGEVAVETLGVGGLSMATVVVVRRLEPRPGARPARKRSGRKQF